MVCAGLLPGCSQPPETRQFEIRVGDDFYTVTETKPGFGLFGGDRASERTVRVDGRDIPCPALPCTAEIRNARAGGGIDTFRLPPPGANLTTE